jgi:hypothetical protein
LCEEASKEKEIEMIEYVQQNTCILVDKSKDKKVIGVK